MTNPASPDKDDRSTRTRVNLEEQPAGDFSAFDGANVERTLEGLYIALTRKAEEALAWYRSKRKTKNNGATFVRWSALFFFGVAALAAVLQASGITLPHEWLGSSSAATLSDADVQRMSIILISRVAYFCAALGAGVLFLDRYMGWSSGWIRYMLTDTKIRRALAQFQMDWVIANSNATTDTQEQTVPKQRLQLLKDFSLKITDLVDDETQQWATEFQASMDLLNKLAKDTQAQVDNGTVVVTVTRGADIDPVINVLVDGHLRASGTGNEFTLNSIPSGVHTVSASGNKKNAQGTSTPVDSAGISVFVAAGGTASVPVVLAK